MFKEFLEDSGQKLSTQLLSSNANAYAVANLEIAFSKIKEAINSRKIVYFFGNGGSAAEASHIAAEFTSFCVKKHDPWGAVCLNDSISSLTAIPNDYSFNELFQRQIQALLKPGDVVVGLSTSGSSRNVLLGLDAATKLGGFSILMTSTRAPELNQEFDIDLTIKVDSIETTRIQEIHLHWLHTIIEYLEVTL
jgi:D-sedoheptulose 7-phosphate isomerase